MGYNEDFKEGYQSGGWSNQPGAEAYNAGSHKGHLDRARDFAAQERTDRERQKSAQDQAKNSTLSFPVTSNQSFGMSQPSANSYGSGSSGGGVHSIGEAAKIGTVGFIILYGIYVLPQLQAWSWPQIVIGVVAAAIAGAIGGAALFITIKILAMVLKIIAALLAIGTILHFFGVLNIFKVFDRLMQIF